MKFKTKEFLKRQLKKFGYKIVKYDAKIESCEKHEKIDICASNEVIINTETVPFSQVDFDNRDKELIILNWVIPPLGIGSGGLLNIFRAISIISNHGIKNRIYVIGGDENTPSSVMKDFVKTYYQIDLGNNEIFPTYKLMEYADAVIATSWITAYVVRNFNNAISKFYFVQDFEPFFYPVGSNYYLAENTYKFGFKGITAGGWLRDKLNEEYGMDTMGFRFAYDKHLYSPKVKKDKKKRIFFYARPFTERRGFEIGVMAFSLLAKRMSDFEVVFAGQSLDDYVLDFEYKDLGIVELKNLCDLYSQCDICVVVSSTNLSLLPIEIMASNSVVMCNKGKNNEWLLNDENSILVDCDPIEIANKLEYYLNNNELLEQYKKNAKAYIENITWENEYECVADYIKKNILTDIESLGK